MSRIRISVVCRNHPNIVLLKVDQSTDVEATVEGGEFLSGPRPANPNMMKGTHWFDPAAGRGRAKYRRRCPVKDCEVNPEYEPVRVQAVLFSVFAVGLDRTWRVTDEQMSVLVARPELAAPFFDTLDRKRKLSGDDLR